MFSRLDAVWSRPVDSRMDADWSRILQFDRKVLSTIISRFHFFQIGRCLIPSGGFQTGRCLISDLAILITKFCQNSKVKFNCFGIGRCLISTGGFENGHCLISDSAIRWRKYFKNKKSNSNVSRLDAAWSRPVDSRLDVVWFRTMQLDHKIMSKLRRRQPPPRSRCHPTRKNLQLICSMQYFPFCL